MNEIHVTVCNTHGVDGIHSESPDCPICALTRENMELRAQIQGYLDTANDDGYAKVSLSKKEKGAI